MFKYANEALSNLNITNLHTFPEQTPEHQIVLLFSVSLL